MGLISNSKTKSLVSGSNRKVLYRYITVTDRNAEPYAHLEEYEVLKETTCGYWLNMDGYTGRKKWVSKTTRKRFAHDTLQGAEISYIKRTSIHISILEDKIKRTQKAYTNFMERMKENALSLYCTRHKVDMHDVQHIEIKSCGGRRKYSICEAMMCANCTGQIVTNKINTETECVAIFNPDIDGQDNNEEEGEIECQFTSTSARHVTMW